MRNAIITLSLLLGLGLALNACVPHAYNYPTGPVGSNVSYEANTNRPGMDYNHFAVNNANQCRNACQADSNCMAYTFVRAGVQGPQAQCWLKNGVPGAVPNNDCISGVRF